MKSSIEKANGYLENKGFATNYVIKCQKSKKTLITEFGYFLNLININLIPNNFENI